MKESRTLEFKEAVTNTFLKTVSAFANYGTGEIVFGIADDGTVKGISNPGSACLDIENRINDSIDPVPFYTLEIDEKRSVIRLTVQEGIHKPYLYKAKAYRRNDTATIEADRLELSRLILEGQDISFEELAAKSQSLKFDILADKLKKSLHIEVFNMDTLKTLELYKDGTGINKAGELLADENGFCGIDIVRFGDSINVILDRETFEKQSILKQYDQALHFYRKYYQYEQIHGALRETVSLLPEEAYREAVANALVHRAWDVNSHITIAMFPDRIEIASPGGLPAGMHEDEYFRGGISVPRNRIITMIFLRLQMIERLGTGIRRIRECYSESIMKPVFELGENSIRVTLPVIRKSSGLPADEDRVYQLVRERAVSSSEVAAATGFGRSKTLTLLKTLVEKGYIGTVGNGRGKRYIIDQ